MSYSKAEILEQARAINEDSLCWCKQASDKIKDNHVHLSHVLSSNKLTEIERQCFIEKKLDIIAEQAYWFKRVASQAAKISTESATLHEHYQEIKQMARRRRVQKMRADLEELKKAYEQLESAE